MNSDRHADLRNASLDALMRESRAIRNRTHGAVLTYSRKVFIPLTQLCRDTCHYCTFAKPPRALATPYLSPDAVLEIARAGQRAGCKEALFTLGDKPELRYSSARAALDGLGFSSTVDYLTHAAGRVLIETGLLPHINAGLLGASDYARLRPVSASMGLMLENVSERLCEPGGPHHGSPDKLPAARLASIASAGEAGIPFTSGLLVGIGETRAERIDSLVALSDLHRRFGHIQEVIIQNFRAKPGTKMADAAEPSEEELLWTIAVARLLLPHEISLQTPPNLNAGRTQALIDAGVNDWGGISPVTIDHVNPEAPWPEIEALAAECRDAGHVLAQRLAVYPPYAREPARWLDRQTARAVQQVSDAEGFGREDSWSPGLVEPAPGSAPAPLGRNLSAWRPSNLDRILSRAFAGRELCESDIADLFSARGKRAEGIVQAADELRRSTCGDVVTYVVNRNINYSNICTFSCGFCAFSKTSAKGGERDRPYALKLEEIAERSREAWARGATEVCLQGGIHPSYTGRTYLDICRAVKAAAPGIHVHAFSPLEITQGAETLGWSLADFLMALKDEGLGSLPGTAAEILDDDVRAVLCPDKLSTLKWLDVVRTAHHVGLPTTATIMFGHVDRPIHWGRHLLAIRRLQQDTGGFTEFVPLPFVHMRSPVFVKGLARKGPTWRETVLMHAISRIVLHGAVSSIQASWVKLGLDGATACLSAGVNDLGGVLMNESISRAAGAAHGQEVTAEALTLAAASAGRPLRQRSTLYGEIARRSDTIAAVIQS